jgi:hypothetical protein
MHTPFGSNRMIVNQRSDGVKDLNESFQCHLLKSFKIRVFFYQQRWSFNFKWYRGSNLERVNRCVARKYVYIKDQLLMNSVNCVRVIKTEHIYIGACCIFMLTDLVGLTNISRILINYARSIYNKVWPMFFMNIASILYPCGLTTAYSEYQSMKWHSW